jgi:hypothetical protein
MRRANVEALSRSTFLQEQCKLVTTQPSQEIAWANDLQNTVTESVAVEILDTVEVVQVYQKKRMLSSAGRWPCYCLRRSLRGCIPA